MVGMLRTDDTACAFARLLAGEVPTEIGALTKLRNVYMNSNSLQGQCALELVEAII